MKIVVALIFFGLLSNQSLCQSDLDTDINQIFDSWNEGESPGGTLGIIVNGELVLARGYGYANLDYAIPNSPTSVFRIASTSKQFTAACIVLLKEQGKLKFEDRLSKFFPQFPAYADDIKISHLLNHTSGIRDYLTLAYLSGMHDDSYYEDAQIMDWLVRQEENNFPPNEEYLYSNSGYWLLGQIVEKVAGENMAEFARKHIFEPLGMINTHFHNDHKSIVKNRATGYMPAGDGYRVSMTTLNMIGDGGIFTTVEDLAVWDRHYYESNVLSQEFWDTMSEKGILNNREVIDYAKGVIWGKWKGLTTLSHGGAFVGYRAQMMRFPENRVTIILLANRSDADVQDKVNQVAAVLVSHGVLPNQIEETSGSLENRKVISLAPSILEKFCGHYFNETGGYTRKIYLKRDTLRYFRAENNESDLLPLNDNEFLLGSEASEVIVRFELSDNGESFLEILPGEGEPIRLAEYQPAAYRINDLEKFRGRYFSEELQAEYELGIVDYHLLLYLNGQEKSPVVPVKTDLFSNPDYGVFRFDRSGDGKVTGFRLQAGRVKNLMFKKI